MVRPPLSHYEHARGERLGTLLRGARGTRSMAEIAAVSGVPAETLRKIETGRIATPAFFTVAALAAALGLALEDLVRLCAEPAAAIEARAAAQARLGSGRPARAQARMISRRAPSAAAARVAASHSRNHRTRGRPVMPRSRPSSSEPVPTSRARRTPDSRSSQAIE